jgi:hypothetical protein
MKLDAAPAGAGRGAAREGGSNRFEPPGRHHTGHKASRGADTAPASAMASAFAKLQQTKR